MCSFETSTRAPAQDARAAGMEVCASPQALTERAEFVLVVVVNAQQIAEVLFGPQGVTHARTGARAVLLASTIAPHDVIELSGRLSRRGFSALDAPISGGPARARAGTMSMMLAGPQATLDLWQPLLRDLADKRFVVGRAIGGRRQGQARQQPCWPASTWSPGRSARAELEDRLGSARYV